MRILFVSDNFPPECNAPATRTYEHALRWVQAGHKVTVVTCAPNFPEGVLFPGYRNAWRTIDEVDGIRVVRVKSYITANEGFLKRSLDYMSFMLVAFFMGFWEKKPDLIVATSPQFFAAIGGWCLALFRRRPFVFEVRDLWPASILAVGAMRKGPLIRALEALELFLYRQAAAIVCVTESFRNDLVARGIPSEKIHVVINGVDLDRYEPRSRDESLAGELGVHHRFVAGYIGTHGMAHSLPKVLEAAEILRNRPDIGFMFVGAGAERSTVEALVKERSLSNVVLVPRQPKERMPSLWSLCDLCVVPLRDSEVFSSVIPSKIFESMGMGVPIVMSIPEGEATRIIRRTGAGICVQPENPVAMAEAIAALADDPTRMRQLRQLASASAADFSREQMATKMLGILERVLEGRA
jgi:glycosyltransferase involved in cell wall biosynthesis